MTDPFAVPADPTEYTEWSEKDRFAIDLPADEYLSRLSLWLPRVPEGEDIWESDTRADRSLPEYLEELGKYTREQREDARRFWAQDERVTRSFLTYLAQFTEVADTYGPPATIAEWWRNDPHADTDLPTYARKMQAAKLRLADVAEQAPRWSDSGKSISLIEYTKKHQKSNARSRWF